MALLQDNTSKPERMHANARWRLFIQMRLAKRREMQGQSEDGHGKPIHAMCMVG